MNIRIYNARILTMEEGRNIFEGELHVEGNRITYVGLALPETDTVWDREIDANGNIIMPGFKNAHTHSGITFLRSYADDLPLLDWPNWFINIRRQSPHTVLKVKQKWKDVSKDMV